MIHARILQGGPGGGRWHYGLAPESVVRGEVLRLQREGLPVATRVQLESRVAGLEFVVRSGMRSAQICDVVAAAYAGLPREASLCQLFSPAAMADATARELTAIVSCDDYEKKVLDATVESVMTAFFEVLDAARQEGHTEPVCVELQIGGKSETVTLMDTTPPIPRILVEMVVEDLFERVKAL